MELGDSVDRLLVVGGRVSALLCDYKDSRAPADVNMLETEVAEFTYVLAKVKQIILGLEQKSSHVDIGHLSLTLVASGSTFSELERELSRIKVQGRKHLWDRIRWAKTEKTLNGLRQRLENHKSSLTIMLTIWASISSTSSDEVLENMLRKQLGSQKLDIISESGSSATTAYQSTSSTPDSPDLSSNRSSFSTFQSPPSYVSTLFRARPYRKNQHLNNMSSRFSCVPLDRDRGQGSWSQSEINTNHSVLSLPYREADLSEIKLVGVVSSTNPSQHEPTTNDSMGESSQLPDSPPPSPDITVQPAWTTWATSLCDAVQSRQNREVHSLLQHGPDINEQNWEPKSPLVIAVESGFEEIVLTLLVFGADAGTKDSLGKSVLHTAVERNDTVIVHSLLKHHAPVDALDTVGNTPLDIAAKLGQKEISDLLIKFGGDSKPSNLQEETLGIALGDSVESRGS